MAELNITIGIEDNASRQIREIDRALNGLNRNLGGLGSSSNAASGGLGRLTAVATGTAAAITVVATATIAAGKAVIDASKQYEKTANSLRLVTTGTEDLNRTMSRLSQLAVQNRTSFADTADLYAKLSIATTDLGYSSEDVEVLTTRLSQALAVAGADAGTASGVIRQLGQAMASGVVRGDEFNSIVEGLGPALAIMAKESGLTVGELRQMAQEGKLTASVFAEMLMNSNALQESFDKTIPTLENLETQLGDTWTKFLKDIGEAYGITDAYRKLIQDTTGTLNSLNTIATGSDMNATDIQARLAEITKQEEELNKALSEQSWYDTIVAAMFGLAGSAQSTAAQLAVLNAEGATLRAELDALNASGKGVEFDSLIADAKALTNSFTANNKQISDFNAGLLEMMRPKGAPAVEGDPALNAYKGAIALADGVTQQASAVQQAKDKIDQYSNAMYLLTEAFNIARMQDQSGLELIQMRNQYYERMNALQAQQVLNLQALTAAQNENAAAIIAANPDLIPQYMREAQALDAKRALLQQITLELAGNTNLTEQNRASLEAMSATLRSQIAELQQGGQAVSQFEQYYQQLIASSNAAVVSQDNVGAAVARLDADLRAGIISLDTYAAAMQQLGDVTPPTFDQQLITLKGNVDAALAQTAANEKLVATLKEQGATTAQITEAEKQLGIVRKVSRGGGGGARVEKLDPYEQFYKGVLDQATRAANEIPFAEQALAQLNKEFEAGAISLEVYKRASEQINEVLSGKTVSVVGVIQDSLSSLAGSISSTLTDVFMGVKGGFEGLKDIALSVVRTIVNSLIQNFIVSPLLKNINNALSSAFTPKGGGGGLFGGGGGLFGFLGGLFGFAEGGSTAIAGQNPILVGEKGPELFYPGKSGVVVPNDKLGGGTSEPLQVVFNIQAIDTQTGTEFLMKNKAMIVGSVQEAYAKRGRQGPLG